MPQRARREASPCKLRLRRRRWSIRRCHRSRCPRMPCPLPKEGRSPPEQAPAIERRRDRPCRCARDGLRIGSGIEEVAQQHEHARACRSTHDAVDDGRKVRSTAGGKEIQLAKHVWKRRRGHAAVSRKPTADPSATTTCTDSPVASPRYPTAAASLLAIISFGGAPQSRDPLVSTTRRTTTSRSARNSFTTGSPVRANADQSTRRRSSPGA